MTDFTVIRDNNVVNYILTKYAVIASIGLALGAYAMNTSAQSYDRGVTPDAGARATTTNGLFITPGEVDPEDAVIAAGMVY